MRFKSFVARFKEEDGQAIILVALAMSIFLLGAIGLAIDGSNLYSQRQMAQAAADAAAQAGMMSIFDGTNSLTGNPAAFTAGTPFTCTTSDAETPCVYARNNGFGSSSDDTVAVTFPTSAPGVKLSTSDTTNLIKVTVSRNVGTTLMRLLGPTATTVSATATAAIVNVISPTPILITHPYLASALNLNGNTDTIKICGGPTRSIEVNSSDPNAFSPSQGTVDLSQAGPADSGNCTTTQGGADFGVFGGPTANPNPGTAVNLGTSGTGHYLSHASPIQDPLASVTAPTAPTTPGSSSTISKGTDGCTFTTCQEYSPGLYNGTKGLDLTGVANVIFKPGLYYIQSKGGFTMKLSNGGAANNSVMCVGCTADPDTGAGMLVYDTGPSGSTAGNNPTGGFTIDTKAFGAFQGPTKTTTEAVGTNGCATTGGCVVPTSPYYGILFWEDRTADAHKPPNGQHVLGAGNGCFSVIGTIYITNTLAIMTSSNGAQYQAVEYHGGPCSTTSNEGDIITGTLTLKGGAAIKMFLFPYGFLTVRQVAMVN
jgi:Flp pilus assembly protein TadG